MVKTNTTTKAADKATKTKATEGAKQASTVLQAPKPDPGRAPREDDIGRRERRGPKKDINAEGEGQDKVYSIASRARWGGTETIHQLSQDAQAAEASAAQNREE